MILPVVKTDSGSNRLQEKIANDKINHPRYPNPIADRPNPHLNETPQFPFPNLTTHRPKPTHRSKQNPIQPSQLVVSTTRSQTRSNTRNPLCQTRSPTVQNRTRPDPRNHRSNPTRHQDHIRHKRKRQWHKDHDQGMPATNKGTSVRYLGTNNPCYSISYSNVFPYQCKF